MRNLVGQTLPRCMLLACLMSAPSLTQGAQPGVGLNAEFEVEFLTSIIDHHFSALRMTELAAGTDPTRNPPIDREQEGVARTPGFDRTPPKAHMSEIRSMSRRANRVQREEILAAQGFLRDWYGVEHEPRITQTDRRRLRLLEEAEPGAEFEHLFLEILGRHHYGAVVMANQCLVAADLEHHELMRYCRSITNQVEEIDEMRHMLCEHFGICDYQPLRGLRGRHTGSEGEVDSPDE